MTRPVILPHKVGDGYGWRKLQGRRNWHNGIDYTTAADTGPGSVCNRAVLAMADGVVVFDKDNYNHGLRYTVPEHTGGNMVIVRSVIDGSSYYIRYLHLVGNSVSHGELVSEGQIIGEYGDAGYSFGPHLHVDFWTDAWVNIDPTQLILSNLRRQ